MRCFSAPPYSGVPGKENPKICYWVFTDFTSCILKVDWKHSTFRSVIIKGRTGTVGFMERSTEKQLRSLPAKIHHPLFCSVYPRKNSNHLGDLKKLTIFKFFHLSITFQHFFCKIKVSMAFGSRLKGKVSATSGEILLTKHNISF